MYLERANNATWELSRVPPDQATKAMLGKQQTSNKPMLLLAIFKLKNLWVYSLTHVPKEATGNFPEAVGSCFMRTLGTEDFFRNSACF